MNEPYTDKELRRIQREDHRSPTTLRFLATVARLQERVEEAEERGDGYKSESETSFARARRAEALAERRKEALIGVGSRIGNKWHLHSCQAPQEPYGECNYACVHARAAIEEEGTE